MTIMEAIHIVDERKPNTYSQADKIRWLATLDAMVHGGVLAGYEGFDGTPFPGYGGDTPPETVLLMESPYDECYIRWLEAQIAYADGEYDKYNNAMALFNTLWNAFRNHYNRTRMHKGGRMVFF